MKENNLNFRKKLKSIIKHHYKNCLEYKKILNF